MCLAPKKVLLQPYKKVNEKTGEIYTTRRIKFLPESETDGINTDYIPCGKCEECRAKKAQDWACRCVLEAQNHTKNAFLTLTYDNAHLPKGKTLYKRDLQLFWKKLRKHLKDIKISYLVCGEYGSITKRPHYHAAVFGWFPDDVEIYKQNYSKDFLYTSKTLTKIWGKGFVIIGHLTYQSAAYIARYVFKKSYGADKIPVKEGKTPEFIIASKKPAIAKNWYTENKKFEKILQNKGVMIPTDNGIKIFPIPQYLRNCWKNFSHSEYYKYFDKLKEETKQKAEEILKQTDKNFGHYKQTTKAKKTKSLKILDKFRTKL